VHSWVERSEALQNVLIKAKESGLILGWRDEAFSFWSSECIYPDTNRTPFIAVERSGFRYLGMLSHAVHINGFTSEGKMWCGRRSLQKTVDPGLLDNVSAGGLTSGDNLHQCATRELQEEAGLLNLPTGALSDMGSVRISRMRPEGWHEEVLHVFNLDLPEDFEPVNQDGEVTEFLCLAPLDLLERIRNCEFTLDAALAIAQGLSRGNVQTQKNHDLAS
jgi:8-oxo-dGTP pyrophosphatase MutT (NUDIX family)